MAMALVLACTALPTCAAPPLPMGTPQSLGFTQEGLARIDRFFAGEIDAGRLPGAVIAIARDGKLVHYKAYGYLNKDSGEPMPLDAIFSLASMTKVMTAVGGLALDENGQLPLKSRLGDTLPEFARMNVGVVVDGALKLEPASPITIQDLYRHTSGMTYSWRGDTPVHKMSPPGSALAALQYTGDEFIAKMAATPLLYQPGTVWDYGLSFDVLGLAIEKVSGQRLGSYLKSAVWDKVGMPDTAFQLPVDKRKRQARPLARNPITGSEQGIPLLDTPAKFDCAGGCAFGTVGDYLRFGQMLLNGGEIDGKRVLSPKTVRQMTSDHLGTRIKNSVVDVEPELDGYGFGLGVAVRMVDGVAAMPGAVGAYTWDGANGTGFWVDPKERLVVVYGTAAPSPSRFIYREQVGVLVYGAMLDLPMPSK